MAAAVIQKSSQRLGLENDNDFIYYTFSGWYNLKPHKFQLDEPFAKVHVACCIYQRSPIKTEPPQHFHDSVELPPQRYQGGSANEAQGESIMVDGDSPADMVSPS